MRTKSEVLKARQNAVYGGCCDRFADMKGCDCLETAVPDGCGVPGHDLECEACGVRLYGKRVEDVCRYRNRDDSETTYVGISSEYGVRTFRRKEKKVSEESHFKIGDQVRIKSGGIVMTVVGITPSVAKTDPNYVMVMLYEDGKMRRDCLPPESLREI